MMFARIRKPDNTFQMILSLNKSFQNILPNPPGSPPRFSLWSSLGTYIKVLQGFLKLLRSSSSERRQLFRRILISARRDRKWLQMLLALNILIQRLDMGMNYIDQNTVGWEEKVFPQN